MTKDLENLAINQARGLAIDQVQAANSGHPGAPLGAMPMVYTLWSKHMRFSPEQGDWPNRDRFVLSAGHASAMLYSLGYLFGFDYSLEDLKNFRQLKSKTPGHPDYDLSLGVEMHTGPLGQGFASSVGMALAEKRLAALFNTDEHKLFDYYTYVYAGDGCMMEGVTSEAASLAGHLALDRLIVLYDSNEITIDGRTNLAWSEDVGKRYEAYGWQYLFVEDGNNLEAISQAIEEAKADTTRPTLIEVKTKIGFASPVADSSKAHGAPLGAEGVDKTKVALGLNPDQYFHVDEDVLNFTRAIQDKGREAAQAWYKEAENYIQTQGEKGDLLQNYLDGTSPYLLNVDGFSEFDLEKEATRNISHSLLNLWAEIDPLLFGGSADLAGSNKTTLTESTFVSAGDYTGQNIHFGVREHAMGAITNGLTLSGFHAYCSTFMVFSDYMRYAIRMAALMEIPTLFIMTHDSIGVGEDGETHQPVEHYASLRAIPHLNFWRPADYKELAAAYSQWDRSGPSVFSLTRQSLPTLEHSSVELASNGAYILEEANVEENCPELILLSTGSEVHVALEAFRALAQEGKSVRIVSMPSMEVFEKQSAEYKESVLPRACGKRIAVEAGIAQPWYRYLGTEGVAVSMEDFGLSGKAEEVFEHFGFTKDNILDQARELMDR